MTRFQSRNKHDGFDEAIPWLLVPNNQPRFVDLIDGQNLEIVSTRPNVAKVSTIASETAAARRQLWIQPVSTGKTLICARNGNVNHAVLEVKVAARLRLTLALHFVSDLTGRKTSRSRAGLGNMLSRLNEIYTPQTNIEFAVKSVQDIKVERDLGWSVCDEKNKKEELAALAAKADAGAHIPVHFVWRCSSSEMGVTLWEKAVPKPQVLIPDHPGWRDAQSLAHEAGHALMLEDTHPKCRKNNLMHENTDGIHIPKEQALKMRSGASRLLSQRAETD